MYSFFFFSKLFSQPVAVWNSHPLQLLAFFSILSLPTTTTTTTDSTQNTYLCFVCLFDAQLLIWTSTTRTCQYKKAETSEKDTNSSPPFTKRDQFAPSLSMSFLPPSLPCFVWLCTKFVYLTNFPILFRHISYPHPPPLLHFLFSSPPPSVFYTGGTSTSATVFSPPR